MKKTNIKRLAAFTASILAVAALAVPMTSVMTADAAGTIEITDTVTNSKLAAYQVFAADDTIDGQLVVTGWGTGIKVDDIITALTADTAEDAIKTAFNGKTIANDATGAQAVADILSANNTNTALAEAFARLAAKNITGDGASATGDSTTKTIENLANGYYVVVDTEAASNGNYKSYTLGILQVVDGDTTTANVKRDYPTFDKKIGDVNDSSATATTDATVTFNEAADHDIGDDVPFKLIATVPSNIAKYDVYKMVFHDDLQAGVFSFNKDSVTVTYYPTASDAESGSNGVTVDATTAVSTDTDDKFNTTTGKAKDFTVTIDDVTTISGIAANGVIVVDYTATLTDTANLGSTGNWNGAYLEYSNNPNYSGTGDTGNTDTSPVDYVVAFTYQTVIDKLDGATDKPLAGAEFTLEKLDAEGNVIDSYTATKTDGDTRFVFSGLDDGTYLLTETAPTDYNAVSPIKFNIVAGEVQTDSSEALESLTATTAVGSEGSATFATGKVYVIADSKATATGADNGSVSTTIENLKGSSLPSTGGIGTTLFYIGGGALALGAGVLLVSKKRMSNK